MSNRNKKIVFVLFLVITLATGALRCSQGEQKEVQKITNFEECASAGNPVMESYPRRCATPDGKTFVEDIGNELEKTDLIRVSKPRPNQVIKSPLNIEGEARGFWFFEASFPIKLFDEKDNLLGTAIAQAQGEWMTKGFVPFRARLEFSTPEANRGVLVLEKDNPSGLPEHDDELHIPVRFEKASTGHLPERKMTRVKVYFINKEVSADPQFDCTRVFPLEREIPKTESVARATLQELLKGPSEEEREKGYMTTINPGVEIQKLTIENGTAKVDFDEQLGYRVGGSCRVSAIRAQIGETLKQFPSVQDVIISINGRTEDILQP
ncbi:MAG TPA: GerMN domain-containing protein [Thermodesulfobacteriota bacterium]|nr:GerMN domain-containing protein [Thermodesulfobacteriota bacterium]